MQPNAQQSERDQKLRCVALLCCVALVRRLCSETGSRANDSRGVAVSRCSAALLSSDACAAKLLLCIFALLFCYAVLLCCFALARRQCSQTRSRASESKGFAVLRCSVDLFSLDACAAKRAAERARAEAVLCCVALARRLCSDTVNRKTASKNVLNRSLGF